MKLEHRVKSRRFAIRLCCNRMEERVTPTTFTIANGDVAGLVAAITTSNTNNQPDIINLAAGGTYTFTTRADNSLGGNALPEIDLDHGLASNSLTINGNGATVQRSTASGTPTFRFLKLGPTSSSASVAAVDLTINDLTMTNFSAPTPTDASTPAGGAITVNRGNITLTNCVLTNDSAETVGALNAIGMSSQTVTLNQCIITNDNGGSAAVQVQGASLIVTGGTISNNISGTGGIFFQTGTTCNVTGTTISNNAGFGITALGQVNLTQATVSGNSRQGVYVIGTLNLLDSAVSGNGTAALDLTGGIGILGSTGIASNLTITNSTIDGNTGTNVGGLNIDAGGSTTFQANINDDTITNNQGTTSSALAGGIRVASGTSATVVRVGDTIIAGNTSAVGAPDILGSYNSQGYDFIGDGTGSTNIGLTAGNHIGTTTVPLDPLLDPLANNGGPTLTRLPTNNSPVIDAGNPSFVPPPDTDQRGQPRVHGAAIDIGAVELQTPLVDLAVSITDMRTNAVAGTFTRYTVVVSNSGPETATGADFFFPAPSNATLTWTSIAVGGATGNTASSGSINDSLTLPAGSSVTYTVIAKIAVKASGTLIANAQIGVPSGEGDTNTANNSATDTDTITTHVSLVAVGPGAGSLPIVNVYDAATGNLLRTFAAFDENFLGGVRVATADINGDGTDDIIAAAGPGGLPEVRVFDGKTGAILMDFLAYAPTFTGGVFVAAGDVNGDGVPDIITGAGAGGGPHVRIFDGVTGAVIREFYAYSPKFKGGVTVAAGDVNGDGLADVITGAGAGGGPQVSVFSGSDGSLIDTFYAYAPTFAGGVNVAAGDIDGDGRADIITGAGAGGGPHVRVFSGATGDVLTEFYAFDPTFRGGVQVSAVDLNGDGLADILTGAGYGGGPRVRAFLPTDGSTLFDFYAFSPADTDGVFVG